MSKRRVFELAKEFNTDSKVVLEILKRNNYKVNNNFSGVGEAEYNVVKQELQKSAKPASPAPKKPEKDYSSQDGRVKTEKHSQPKEKAAAEKATRPAQEKEERHMHQPAHTEPKHEECQG